MGGSLSACGRPGRALPPPARRESATAAIRVKLADATPGGPPPRRRNRAGGNLSRSDRVDRVVGRLVVASLAAALSIAACGGSASTPPKRTGARAERRPTASVPARTVTTPAAPKPRFPPWPQLLGSAQGTAPTGFVPAVRWNGQTAAWVARSPDGITLLSFDQRLVQLRLHSGTEDAGSVGWRYGPAVRGAELGHLVAAFNGGFRLSTGAGGFESYGRVAVPLQAGIGSVVTYTDGTTDVGSWHQEVPAPGKQVASVRQNLPLLIDHGTAASTVGCNSCWGATLGGVIATARSGLGVTADGRLIWAAGEGLTVAQLADALLSAHVVRAVELDINPEWVAGYLYGHRGGQGPPVPVPALAHQSGIPGQYLVPWSRDFFTIEAR